jgi:hypothetical protein
VVTKGTLSDIRVHPTADPAFFEGEWRDGSGRKARGVPESWAGSPTTRPRRVILALVKPVPGSS